MKMWRAYLVAILGTCVIYSLHDATFQGWKAYSFLGLGIILWVFSIAEALIAVMEISRETLEAQLLIKPEVKNDLHRYMLQVDTNEYIFSSIPDKDMKKLAIGLLFQKRPFSEREWAGKISNFRAIQDEFEARQLVHIIGNKRKLNGRGRRALLEAYFRRSPSPSLPLGLKSVR